MKIDITPKAHEDLERLYGYLSAEFGETRAKEIISSIYDDLESLANFPNLGTDIISKYGIHTSYLCLITNKNYAFYRIENDTIKIIRVLDQRQDFMQILFGVKTTSPDTDKYWNE